MGEDRLTTTVDYGRQLSISVFSGLEMAVLVESLGISLSCQVLHADLLLAFTSAYHG